MAPPHTKDIGKAATDLLTKDFKTGKSTVELKTTTPNNVTFTPSATKQADKIDGQLKAQANLPLLEKATLEVTLATAGTLAATIEAADAIAKNLTLTLDCETPAPGKPGLLAVGKATAEYKNPALSAKASFDYYKGDASASASTAYKSLVFGASADYAVPKSAVTKYLVGAQYTAPDFTVAAKVSEAIGKPDGAVYACSYLHSISKRMQVGTELTKASKKSDVALAFGCAYKLDKDVSVKGKVDSEGILSASYKQKLSPISTLTLATAVDTVNLAESSKHKFGLVLNITP